MAMGNVLAESFVTVAQAADSLGVSVQRVHQLLKTHSVGHQVMGNMKLIPKSELRKIPKERPTGIHVGKKK